jgi:HSP20 family protein
MYYAVKTFNPANKTKTMESPLATKQTMSKAPMNIAEFSEYFEVYLMLPGFNKEHLNISVEDQILVVNATMNVENSTHFTHREFGHSGMERRITLSNKLDTDKIEAELNNGILKLTIPKKEELKPRAIDVK